MKLENVTVWGPNWLIQLILDIPSVLLVPFGPLWFKWSPWQLLSTLYLFRWAPPLYVVLSVQVYESMS